MLLLNLNTITHKILKNCAKLYKSRKVKSNAYSSRCLSYCRLLKTILFKFSSRSKVSNSRNSLNNSNSSNNNTLPLNKLLLNKILLNKVLKTPNTPKTNPLNQKN